MKIIPETPALSGSLYWFRFVYCISSVDCLRYDTVLSSVLLGLICRWRYALIDMSLWLSSEITFLKLFHDNLPNWVTLTSALTDGISLVIRLAVHNTTINISLSLCGQSRAQSHQINVLSIYVSRPFIFKNTQFERKQSTLKFEVYICLNLLMWIKYYLLLLTSIIRSTDRFRKDWPNVFIFFLAMLCN